MSRFIGSVVVLAGATVLLGLATLAIVIVGMVLPLLAE
jgi:hypothetical protein